MLNIIFMVVVAATIQSCSHVRSLSLKTAAPLFMDSMSGIESEANFEAFKNGTPANLSLIDGLLAVRPYDENLLAAAIKGNAGYGFGVMETLHLENKLADNDKTFYKDQAIAYYAKALDYGIKYLQANDLDLETLVTAVKDAKGVAGILESQLSGDQTSLESILFTAQSLGSLINLQRENIQLVSYLPLAKGMFDWVCDIQPDIAHGTCAIFFGSYEAGRPAMLGGNPEKGKEIFEKAIESNPHNWLTRVAYIEHYALPQYNEDVYRAQKKELSKFQNQFKEVLNWDPNGIHNPAFKDKTLRLYQAIAIKRFEILKKYEKDLF